MTKKLDLSNPTLRRDDLNARTCFERPEQDHSRVRQPMQFNVVLVALLLANYFCHVLYLRLRLFWRWRRERVEVRDPRAWIKVLDCVGETSIV